MVKVTPLELGSERIVEKIDDLTVPRTVEQTVHVPMPLQEGITEVIKPIPQERILEHMDEQFMGVWETIHQQHISEHTFEQSEDGPMPQITVPVPFQEETDDVIQSFPAERHSERTIVQIVDTSVPQIQEQIVEVAEIIPQERTSEHTVEPFADVPVPQIQEQIV